MIDWTEQWELHAPNFHSGYAHIELGPGLTARLKPGPGFGDLSHPTTQLVLKMMKPLARDKRVIDIGCGSGVLSVCAAILGACEVHGIDICKEALLHAKENARLNNTPQVRFGKKAKLQHLSDTLILINMISSEQKIAWGEHPYLHRCKGLIISSGILEEQKAAYLRQAAEWGWSPLAFEKEGDWLGILFSSNNS